jgi:RNA polymerase sigma-70 factor, ECF subfamily
MGKIMIEVNTDLIHRAQLGDAETISGLYERFQLSVFRYLYYRTGDHQTAEDLTSEVFERMLRFISGFRPPSASFQGWLFQIARNLCNDHFRRTISQPVVPLEENMALGTDRYSPSAERVLTSQGLRQALDQLNEEQRDVIILRFIACLPVADVASSLNKSEDAVKGLQRRGLLALRQILTDWEVRHD